MRILVCGSRDYSNVAAVHRVLDLYSPIRIVAGDATGADFIALEYAKAKNISRKRYDADWTKYGLAAGPIRNKRMITEETIDLVIAFPGGKGTTDMIKQAKQANIRVYEYEG